MLDIEQKDRIVILRMNDGKVNALNYELLNAVENGLDQLASMQASALVFTGTGKCFSAGVDLFRLLDEGEDYLTKFLNQLETTLFRLFTLDIPVVAAVNGYAIAGGCILACACDLKIMADGKGRIGVPELRVGLPFPPLAMAVLRFSVPHRFLRELIYMGKSYLPADARQRGLVDEVISADALDDEALRIAAGLADTPNATYNLTKRMLRQEIILAYEKQKTDYSTEVNSLWSDPDIRAHVRSYLEQTLSGDK